MNHLVMLPCRGRPENIFRFIENFILNTTDNTKLIIGIDEDDIDNHKKLFETHFDKIMVMKKFNLSEKLNFMWKNNPGYKYYTFLADDTIIHTKNWDNIFCDYIENNFDGDGIVFANDLRNPKSEDGHLLPNHWTISASLLNVMEFFALPVCNHMWIDNFTLQLGLKLNCIKYMEDVLIEHKHFVNGDTIYQYSQQFFDQDKISYENYLKTNFDDLIKNILDYKVAKSQLVDMYKKYCSETTDINEHLPTIKKYASKCNSVVEFGSRGMHSSIAIINGMPKIINLYDINHPSRSGADLDLILSLAKKCKLDISFNLKNVLDVVIDETDMLFIDTWHSYQQLSKELELHVDKVKKYLIFHDTTLFGDVDEKDWYNLKEKHTSSPTKQGLNTAIDEFLLKNLEWKLLEKFVNNNGLTVLEKKI